MRLASNYAIPLVENLIHRLVYLQTVYFLMIRNSDVDYLVALDCWHCQLYIAHLDLFSCYLLRCGITDVVQEPE